MQGLFTKFSCCNFVVIWSTKQSLKPLLAIHRECNFVEIWSTKQSLEPLLAIHSVQDFPFFHFPDNHFWPYIESVQDFPLFPPFFTFQTLFVWYVRVLYYTINGGSRFDDGHCSLRLSHRPISQSLENYIGRNDCSTITFFTSFKPNTRMDLLTNYSLENSTRIQFLNYTWKWVSVCLRGSYCSESSSHTVLPCHLPNWCS